MNTRQQVIKYISDNSVTLAQVKSMTQAQFNNALNVNLTVAHIKNIMRPIITTMQRAENNSKLQGLKTQAKTWVQVMSQSDWIAIVGEDVTAVQISNHTRSILRKRERDTELNNLKSFDEGALGESIRLAAKQFGYNSPDAVFDHRNKHIIIRLNGAPLVEEDL